jgi:hypothetical protein
VVQFASPETSVDGTSDAKAFYCILDEAIRGRKYYAYTTNDLMNVRGGILIWVDETEMPCQTLYDFHSCKVTYGSRRSTTICEQPKRSTVWPAAGAANKPLANNAALKSDFNCILKAALE